MIKSIVVLLFTCLTSFSVLAAEPKLQWQDLFTDVPSISKTEMEQQAGKLLLVDVRSKFYFDQKHVEGAKHVPFSSRMFVLEMEGLRDANKDKKIVVYCDSDNCIKSYRAVEKCQQEKIADVVVFDLQKDMREDAQNSMLGSI